MVLGQLPPWKSVLPTLIVTLTITNVQFSSGPICPDTQENDMMKKEEYIHSQSAN